MAENRFADLADAFDNVLQNVAGANASPRMASPPPDLFDYSVTPLSADEIEMVQVRRRRIVRILSAAIIEAGENFLEIKKLILSRCPRGTWTKWLRTGSPVSESTTRNYMAAAEWAAKCPTVGEMAPGAIYKGAAAPDEVRERIVDRLLDGEIVVAEDIDEMIDAFDLANPYKSKRGKRSSGRAAQSGRSLVVQKVRHPDEGSEESAATEIIAQLSDWFDQTAIQGLVELIGRTSYDALRRMLESRQI